MVDDEVAQSPGAPAAAPAVASPASLVSQDPAAAAAGTPADDNAAGAAESPALAATAAAAAAPTPAAPHLRDSSSAASTASVASSSATTAFPGPELCFFGFDSDDAGDSMGAPSSEAGYEDVNPALCILGDGRPKVKGAAVYIVHKKVSDNVYNQVKT